MKITSIPSAGVLAMFGLAVVAAFPAPVAAAPCPVITIDSVSSGTGSPGDAVVLSGDGFCAPADAFFAWGTDGNRGFGFTINAVTQTQLLASLGPVHETVTGPLRLWFGKRVNLPDSVLELSTGIYHLHDASVLLPLETTSGPAFSAQAGTAAGFTSELVNGELRIDFGTTASAPGTQLSEPPSGPPGDMEGLSGRQLSKPESEHSVSVIVLVRTGGGSGGEPPEEDPNSRPPNHWVLFLEVDCYGPGTGCSGDLTGTLSGGLGTVLAPLGMATRIEGSTVVLFHNTNSITAGFATVTPF